MAGERTNQRFELKLGQRAAAATDQVIVVLTPESSFEIAAFFGDLRRLNDAGLEQERHRPVDRRARHFMAGGANGRRELLAAAKMAEGAMLSSLIVERSDSTGCQPSRCRCRRARSRCP